jgi:hypothetical protein
MRQCAWGRGAGGGVVIKVARVIGVGHRDFSKKEVAKNRVVAAFKANYSVDVGLLYSIM